MSIATNNRIPFYPFSDIRVARIVKPRGEREYCRDASSRIARRLRGKDRAGAAAADLKDCKSPGHSRNTQAGGRANTIKTQGDDNPRSSATPTPKAVPGNGGGLDGVGSRFDVWL